MCATGESVMPGGDSDVAGERARDGGDDADDDRSSKRVVRGEPESGGMRVLAERDDDHLPGIPVRDGYTATTTRQDGDDGGDADVRHERRRGAGSGDSADERDAGELQPDPSDDPGA